jgi:hypothetical protein
MSVSRSAFVVIFALTVPVASDAQQTPPPCADVDGFSTVDFWVGEWVVVVGEDTVGQNTIEKVLDGCAVTERWRSAAGGEGRSLFYYIPATGTWEQVWVTSQATAPGGVKEKTLVERYEDGGVRFQGEIAQPDGGTYLDRTTLRPMHGGRVHQHIEISTDGGESWRTTFDAVYLPAGDDPARVRP